MEKELREKTQGREPACGLTTVSRLFGRLTAPETLRPDTGEFPRFYAACGRLSGPAGISILHRKVSKIVLKYLYFLPFFIRFVLGSQAGPDKE